MEDHELLGLAAAGKLAQNAQASPKGAFPATGGYVAEPKFDGWRIIAHVTADGDVTLFSRSGNTYSGKLPAIEAELRENFPTGAWLDGEAVALKYDDGRVLNEWGTVQSLMTKGGVAHIAAEQVTFMVFDLIAHGGIDARALPYGRRRLLLDRIFATGTFDRVELAPLHEAGEAVHDDLVAMGFEGTILKRLDAPYGSGKRDTRWIKVKPQITIDAVIMGFKPGENGFAGLVGAVIFGQYAPCEACGGDGKDPFEQAAGALDVTCPACGGTGRVLIERGRCSGMDMRTRIDMSTNPDKYVGRAVEIAHMGVNIGNSESGRFRHPQMRRMRPDKAPMDCVMADA